MGAATRLTPCCAIQFALLTLEPVNYCLGNADVGIRKAAPPRSGSVQRTIYPVKYCRIHRNSLDDGGDDERSVSALVVNARRHRGIHHFLRGTGLGYP